MLDIPVVMIQYGNQEYYSRVIKQAKKYNKTVYAIGDHLPPSDTNISLYMLSASRFKAIYQHLSTNGEAIELMCFNR